MFLISCATSITIPKMYPKLLNGIFLNFCGFDFLSLPLIYYISWLYSLHKRKLSYVRSTIWRTSNTLILFCHILFSCLPNNSPKISFFFAGRQKRFEKMCMNLSFEENARWFKKHIAAYIKFGNLLIPQTTFFVVANNIKGQRMLC